MDGLISKGIPSDIDLTERGDFRNGVAPPLMVDRLPEGMPWDANGKESLRAKASQFSSISRYQIDQFDTIDYTFALNRTKLGYRYTEDRDRIIERWRETEDIRYLALLEERIDIDHGVMRLDTAESEAVTYVTSPSVYQYRGTNSTTSVGWSSDYDDNLYSTSWTTSSAMCVTADIRPNITPNRFVGTTLTTAEMNGAPITESGELLKKKVELYNFIQSIRPYVHRHNLIRRNHILPDSLGEASDAISDIGHDLDNWNWLTAMRPMSLKLNRESNEDILCDETDWMIQPVYTDRGVHLIRRPRNSHELMVDLDTREFVDEDDRPLADANAHLTTDRKYSNASIENRWSGFLVI